MTRKMTNGFRRGQKVGKYKLLKKLGEGGFGIVYKALDEVEGQHVALKIQTSEFHSERILQYFKHEIRLMSRIEHKNILKLKNADVVDGRLFIASELGLCSLDDRNRRLIRSDFALSVLLFSKQIQRVKKNSNPFLSHQIQNDLRHLAVPVDRCSGNWQGTLPFL